MGKIPDTNPEDGPMREQAVKSRRAKRGKKKRGAPRQPQRSPLEGRFPYYEWDSAEQMKLMEVQCPGELAEWRRVWAEHQNLRPGDPLSTKKNNRINHREVLTEVYLRLREAYILSGGIAPQ